MAKHIGIVAVSPEGAALCYQQVSRRAARYLPPHEHPKITIHNEPLAKYIDAAKADDWHTVGDLLRRSAERLASCGAEFCFTPDNAVQHGVHLAEVGSPIPWLTMTDLVAQALSQDQRRVVGLLGTKMVTMGSSYQTHLGLIGIQVLAPEEDDAEELDRIIFEELVYGHIETRSRDRVLGIVERFAQRGCECLILGCSEGSLLLAEESSQLPLYDSSTLLAEGAVRQSIGK